MNHRLYLVRAKQEGKLDPLPEVPVVPAMIVTAFVYSCFWALLLWSAISDAARRK